MAPSSLHWLYLCFPSQEHFGTCPSMPRDKACELICSLSPDKAATIPESVEVLHKQGVLPCFSVQRHCAEPPLAVVNHGDSQW